MQTLTELRDKVAALADGAREPEPLCWLEHDEHGEWIYAHYCPACAEKVKAWLCGGDVPHGLQPHMEHPPDSWRPSSPDELHIANPRGYDMETDTTEWCELCEALLFCSLTDYGIEREVAHFENVLASWRDGTNPFEPLSPDQWREVLEFVDDLSLWDVHETDNDEIRDTHRRATEVANGLLQMHEAAGGVSAQANGGRRMTISLIGARITYQGTGNTYTVTRPGQDCLVLERSEPYKKMLVKAKILLRMEEAGAVRIDYTTEEAR